MEKPGNLSTAVENEKCQPDIGGEGKAEMWKDCSELPQNPILLPWDIYISVSK